MTQLNNELTSMQKLYREYEATAAWLDSVEKAIDSGIQANDMKVVEALEEHWNAVYQKHFNYWQELVQLVMKHTHCTASVAKGMIASDKFAELMYMKIVDC